MIRAEVSAAEWTPKRKVNVVLAVLALQDPLSFSDSIDATKKIHIRNLKTCLASCAALLSAIVLLALIGS